jgi:hypothetical protein
MRNVLLISITLLGLAIPVSADQAPVSPNSTARFGAQRPPQSSPYARLFEVREALKSAQQAAGVKPASKKTVCGMTMIEVDPAFDPKMKVTPRKDPNLRHTIRAIDPPICNPTK